MVASGLPWNCVGKVTAVVKILPSIAATFLCVAATGG